MCSVFVLARICERCKYWWLSRCRTVSVALVLPSAFTDAKPCRGNQHQQRAAKTRVPNVNGCMRAIVRMFLCVFACICARVDPIIHEVTCLPSSQRRILFLSFLFIFYVYITCALDEFFFLLIFISVFFFLLSTLPIVPALIILNFGGLVMLTFYILAKISREFVCSPHKQTATTFAICVHADNWQTQHSSAANRSRIFFSTSSFWLLSVFRSSTFIYVAFTRSEIFCTCITSKSRTKDSEK